MRATPAAVAAFALVSASTRAVADPAQNAVAEQTMDAYVMCLLQSPDTRPSAMVLIKRSIFSRAFQDGLRRLQVSSCLRPEFEAISFGTDLLRKAIYAGVYRYRFARTAAPDFANVPQADAGLEDGLTIADIPPDIVAARRFGDCVARRETVAVHNLLLTPIRSDAEAAALAKLTPKLPDCVGPDDQIKFSRSMLRGALAEAMLKLRDAQSVQAATSTPAMSR